MAARVSADTIGQRTRTPVATVRARPHPWRVARPATAPSTEHATTEVSSPPPAMRNPTTHAATVPATIARSRWRALTAAIGTIAAANSADASGSR